MPIAVPGKAVWGPMSLSALLTATYHYARQMQQIKMAGVACIIELGDLIVQQHRPVCIGELSWRWLFVFPIEVQISWRGSLADTKRNVQFRPKVLFTQLALLTKGFVMSNGPLEGLKVIEISGIGPGRFCGMLLSDLGADVVRVDRPDGWVDIIPPKYDLFNRGKRSISVDLKSQEGIETILALVEKADIIFEGFRPGVAEDLGIGPFECLNRNPKIVYGRMTGWGQEGPLSHTSGHDINYIALSGPLHTIGAAGGQPQPPLAFVGDSAGALYLAVGLLSALYESHKSGQGQVIDAAIVDSSAHLMTLCHIFRAAGTWIDERGANLVDGGAPFYATYGTSDGQYMAVGAMEPQFFEEFSNLLGLEVDPDLDRTDRESWPLLHRKISDIFALKTQAEWMEVFDGSDACVTPVLSIESSVKHPHNVERGTFVEHDGIVQPAPAPRFSRTEASLRSMPCQQHSAEVVNDWLGQR